MLAYLVRMFWYHRGHLRFLKRIFRNLILYKRFTLKWLYILTFFYIYILILWPSPLCNFISFSLKRWIFSRQSPRSFSRQHPFRRLRDIYRKLIRKINQKTISSICRTGHEIRMFVWTHYYYLDQGSNMYWYCYGWMDTLIHRTLDRIPTSSDIVVVGWTLDPSDLG